MQPFKSAAKGRGHGPEGAVERRVIDYLTNKGWYIRLLHGSTFQVGLPDLFCCHRMYGVRLIEVKDPERTGDQFTPAQWREFPRLNQNGAPIIILTDINDHIYTDLVLANKSNFLLFAHKSMGHRK